MTAFVISLLTFLLLICLFILGCDFVPMFMTWLGRIHIGSFENEKQWKDKAERVALKWVKKLPKIATTDKTAYTFLPRIKGEYVNKKFNAWQEACLLLALKDNEEAKAAAYDFFTKAELEKQEYTPGNAMLLYALLENGFEKDEKVAAAAADYCKKALAVAGMSTLPYNKGSDNHYVDVLGMVCPFLVKYHLTYGSNQALELVKRQFDEYYEYGMHERTGLPVHCFGISAKIPRGIYGWGRGCGWLAFGLAECFRLLDGKESYSAEIKNRLIAYADTVKKYQRKNGSFSFLLGAGNAADSSATAMLAYFFTQVEKIKGTGEFAFRAEVAKKYLICVTRRDGKVDFAQGDSMSGGNYSRRFEPMPAAQAFALMILK
ncbi:MAG: glycoside hydrolase family 88 protein [Clostridia bacterium]|nr:glycoside hydrolase family 88 protein [Clostridia bacterium]